MPIGCISALCCILTTGIMCLAKLNSFCFCNWHLPLGITGQVLRAWAGIYCCYVETDSAQRAALCRLRIRRKVVVITALPARHDVKSEMQRKEKGKWIQWNSSLDFPICILWLNTADMKIVRLHLCLKACPSFLFSTFLSHFPSICGPLLCREPQGAMGRPSRVTWETRMNATTAASPIIYSSCRAPAPQAASMGPWPSHRHLCPPEKGSRAWLRQIHGHSTMHPIPGGVLCLPNAVIHNGSRLPHFVCLLVQTNSTLSKGGKK